MYQNLFKPGLQVLLNDIRYHKYLHRHYHWQIPCQNVVVATRRRQPALSCAFLQSEWWQIIRGAYDISSSRFRSKVFNCILLVFSIRPQVFPLPPAKLSDDQPLGEALATWPNKYHWFKKSYIARKTLTLNRICW